jgi:hypothetical protein
VSSPDDDPAKLLENRELSELVDQGLGLLELEERDVNAGWA